MSEPRRAALIEALYVSLVQTTLPNSLAHNPEVIAEAAKWGPHQTVLCLNWFGRLPSEVNEGRWRLA